MERRNSTDCKRILQGIQHPEPMTRKSRTGIREKVNTFQGQAELAGWSIWIIQGAKTQPYFPTKWSKCDSVVWSSTRVRDLGYGHQSHLHERVLRAPVQKIFKSKEIVKAAGQHFQVTGHDSRGKSHASGVPWQDTQLCDPLCMGLMGISVRSGLPELLLSPAKSSLQPILEWLFAFIWPRFIPKVCFPSEAAGHSAVDTISKQHTSCASGEAPWKVLQDGLEEIWVKEVGLHVLKLRSPEKEQHPSAQTQSFVCKKWVAKRMWNKRAFEMVSLRRK